VKHIQNTRNSQIQNALMAQEVAEAAKLRQAERARTRSAEAVLKSKETGIRKTDEKNGKGAGGQNQDTVGKRLRHYLPDGTVEAPDDPENGPGGAPIKRIDLKA